MWCESKNILPFDKNLFFDKNRSPNGICISKSHLGELGVFSFLCRVADKKIKNELPTDYQLIGIASSLREYKLCYHLNQLLRCDFRKLKDLVFEPTERTRTVQFSVFKAGEEEDLNKFIVFTNKSLGEVLLPEVSNFDYIVQIQGNYEIENVENLINGIRQFPEVMMTAEIPLKKIKSKERLIYEEERPSHRLINTKRFK